MSSFVTSPCLFAPYAAVRHPRKAPSNPPLTWMDPNLDGPPPLPSQIASSPFVLSFFKPTNLDYRFEDLERTFGANSDPVTGKVLDLHDLRQQNAAKILK